MKIKRFLSIPVLLVFLVLGFVYYVTVFVFVEDWLGLQSSPGFLNSLIFSLLGFLCLFSFLACILTDPGGVPPGYVPDMERFHTENKEINRNGSDARQCDKCSVYKPPRAHHCRVCRRCVLKMDHHCIWINNCVGHRNYKSFLLLIFYGTVSAAYSAVCCGLLSWGVSVLLGSLLLWHLYLTSKNMTTIEHHEGKRAAWLAKKSGQTYHHAYNVGAYKNITLVLGPNMVRWFWPAAIDHLKDGCSFPTARDSS